MALVVIMAVIIAVIMAGTVPVIGLGMELAHTSPTAVAAPLFGGTESYPLIGWSR